MFLQLFELFWLYNIFHDIVRETNQYVMEENEEMIIVETMEEFTLIQNIYCNLVVHGYESINLILRVTR